MKNLVVCLGGGCLFAFPMAAAQSTPSTQRPDTKATRLYVAPTGSDENPGTMEKPFATMEKAKDAVQERVRTSREPIRILLREGTYYLNQPLELKPESSGTTEAPVVYAAYPGERVTLSGGRRLDCNWRAYQNGIMMCELPEVKAGKLDFTQLFVNGKRQVRARYPNYDNSRPGKSGYIYPANTIPANMVDPQPGRNDDMVYTGVGARGILFDPASFTQKRWARPQEAVLHIFRAGYWGNLQWRIKNIDYERRAIWFGDGGHQMGAKWDPDPSAIDSGCRFFVENVLEELDSPGEWYLDAATGILYFMPQPGLDLRVAVVEVPVLESVIRIVGTQGKPVSHLTFDGFRIAHTASTFLSTYEVPSLSDWSIHRGGSVFLQGTRDCTIRNCWFDAVGGNALFVNQHNRNATVSGCKFTEAGRVEVDAMEPVIIRNNLFEERPESIEGIHGPVFGIDLDDGASNYEIYNNVTKNVSMKLREGAKRTIYNNIWCDSVVAPCFHVGSEYNGDRYFCNITVMSRDDVYSIIAPPARGPWLEEIDHNCFFTRSGAFTARVQELRGEERPDRAVQKYDLEGWRRLGFDAHSVFADPLLVDPERNDFRVRPDSPALKLGFKNFEMGKWGLTDEFPAVWRE